MRTNGYLYYLDITSGGVNDFGEPNQNEAEWSEAIPCHIEKNHDSRKEVYEDGRYRMLQATVLIQEAIPGSKRRIRLETYDEELGEFDIVSITRIPGQGRYEIIV